MAELGQIEIGQFSMGGIGDAITELRHVYCDDASFRYEMPLATGVFKLEQETAKGKIVNKCNN